MSLGYQAVGWNRQKKRYDAVLAAGVAAYLGLFIGLGALMHPNATAETLLIRGLGTAALLLLHVTLAIGPLCRIDRRFLPLLYNRRHLGVTMFTLGLAHGGFSLVQFHALGDRNPLVSLFTSNTRYISVADFPFQALGFGALVILFLMAATSHDFWLANLSAEVWKRLHMMVYLAYALLVAHVALGALQSETSPLLAAVLAVGLAVLIALHLSAARVERRTDNARAEAGRDGYVDVCGVDAIPEDCAHVVSLGGERVAVFRYGGKVSAISNVCRHQNGPLGEGRIIDGCVTCPWHGYQYLPDTGASPPPFTEKVATYRTRVMGRRVLVHPVALEPGTRVEPAWIGRWPMNAEAEFYVGYASGMPAGVRRVVRWALVALAVTVVAVAVVLVIGQRPFPAATFEYGQYRDVQGVVTEHPYAALAAADGGLPWLLVAPGKFGAADAMRGLDGATVRMRASAIYRDGERMLEMAPGSLERVPAAPVSTAGAVDLGATELRGEIVDTKCYLGVMNPGNGKVHRDCAVRCISGGIPPGLLVRDAAGTGRVLLLAGPGGRPLGTEVLDYVAEPVAVRGRLMRVAGRLALYADPAAILRVE